LSSDESTFLKSNHQTKKNIPTMKGKVARPAARCRFQLHQSALREWAGIARLAGKTAEFNPFVQTSVLGIENAFKRTGAFLSRLHTVFLRERIAKYRIHRWYISGSIEMY
jgi:hypothetical protein